MNKRRRYLAKRRRAAKAWAVLEPQLIGRAMAEAGGLARYTVGRDTVFLIGPNESIDTPQLRALRIGEVTIRGTWTPADGEA
jgi:hypothetical protein